MVTFQLRKENFNNPSDEFFTVPPGDEASTEKTFEVSCAAHTRADVA